MNRGLLKAMAELGLETVCQSKALSSPSNQIPSTLAVTSHKAHPLCCISAQVPEPFLLYIRLVLRHLTCFLKVMGGQGMT